MNFEQLKTAWRASLATPSGASELERMSREVHASARRYQRGALLRRVYGTAAFGLALAMLVVLVALPGPEVWPGMRVAIALWVASFIICVVGLWHIRRASHPRLDAPLTTHLEASLGDIRREMAYYRDLRWAFWLPFGVGFAFAMLWNPPEPASQHVALIFGSAVVWLWGFIYAPRHWLKRFQPQTAQLEDMLRETRHDSGTTGDSR